MAAHEPEHDPGRDDFQAIGDIGPQAADALHRVGILRYADLASYTPDALASLLQREAGLRISPRRIASKQWIEQAAALAGSPTSAEPAPLPAAEGLTQRLVPSADQRRWQQRAGFSLFFDSMSDEQGGEIWQVRAYHDESGEEQTFTGATSADWMAWITAHAQLPEALAPTATSTAQQQEHGPQQEQEAPHIGIVDVQVGETSPLPNSPNGHLVAEVRFELWGKASSALADARRRYQIDLALLNLERGSREVVASLNGRLEPGTRLYARRREFPKPQPGRYEVQAIITLLGDPALTHEYSGPRV